MPPDPAESSIPALHVQTIDTDHVPDLGCQCGPIIRDFHGGVFVIHRRSVAWAPMPRVGRDDDPLYRDDMREAGRGDLLP